MPRVAGKSTTLTYDGDTVGGIQSITPPPKRLEMVETTDIDDATMNQEVAITIRGPIQATAYWNKSDTGIATIMAQGEVAATAVATLSDGASYTGSAYAQATEPQSLDRKNRAMINITLEPAAGWTYAAGA
jgi:hypothetical protein